MPKKNKKLTEEIKRLVDENTSLREELQRARVSIDTIKAGNIDALVIAHKQGVKIYTEKSADKLYRIFLEKMHEGAAALHEDGTILYCNSYFATLVRLPLERVIGTKFSDFITESSKKSYAVLIKKGWERYSQGEVLISPAKGNTVPVLMSANTLLLAKNRILTIILTNISSQNENRVERKSILIEKMINVITGINLYTDEKPKLNHSQYISKRLNHSYTYLANIFSAAKGLTIQQFIIINKIEKVKEMLLYGDFNLKEIYYRLHYSSVAHLSNHFKKITGFSASSYKKMKEKK